MSKLLQLSLGDLRRAVAIKQQIERLEKKLTRLLGTLAPAAVPTQRRKMSKAARKAIGAAQRARWSKLK